MNEIASVPLSAILVSNSKQNGSPIKSRIESINTNKTFECGHPGCGAIFSRHSKLVIHLRQHTGERPFKCEYDGCGKSYTNTSHLKRHSQTHKVAKQPVKCPKCSLMVSNQQNLKRHHERVHAENSPFFCKECEKKFNKEYQYKEHMAIHKGIALYECEICSKKCMTFATFKKHERAHTKKEYPCEAPNCSEVFDKWSLLVKHRNSKHITEYRCKVCDKVFLLKTQLKSHSFVHSDDRSILPCPYDKCSRFYFFKRNLEHHVRTNHLGNKYHCDICDLRLSTKQKIIDHMNMMHLAKKKKKKKQKRRRKTPGEPESRRRNDAGMAKKSMLSKLIGLDLPIGMEKEFLNRRTTIQYSEEDLVHNSNEIVNNCAAMPVNKDDQTPINGSKKVTESQIDNLSPIPNMDELIKVIDGFSDHLDKQRIGNCNNNNLLNAS